MIVFTSAQDGPWPAPGTPTTTSTERPPTMTTETHRHPRPPGAAVVARAAGVGLAGSALLVLAGALAQGAPAAAGAAVGSVLTVGVLAFGTGSVGAVARLMPSFSLVAAMLTYVLQLLVLLVALLAVSRSGLVGSTLDRGWVAAGVIVATITWMAAHVVIVTRWRIPVYDLPEADAR